MLSEEQVNVTSKIFCTNKFKKFDLRERKEVRDFHKPSAFSKHVLSDLDGMWNKKLKDMCLTFMDLHGPLYIYQKWFKESQNINFQMISILCRSEGLFGHCNNIYQDFTQDTTTIPFIDKTISKCN